MEGAVCMGMNAIVSEGEGATLHVGQDLEVSLAF
jgi:hypothetical protein